jgi:hypothetical protein
LLEDRVEIERHEEALATLREQEGNDVFSTAG